MPALRTYPAFPIPAVGAVILAQGHVLLIQRGQPPAAGKWTLPGGVVEVGESPEEAVIREVYEECALEVLVGSVLEVVNRIIWDDCGAVKYHYVIIDYLADWQASDTKQRLPEIGPLAETDVQQARWVPLQEVEQYDLTEGVLPIIRAGMAMQANEIRVNTDGGNV